MLKMNKKTVFLGTATDVEREAFHDYYLEQVAPVIAAHPSVNQYYANKIVVPSQELIDAGWGWGGYDDSGIFAMDEIWCKEGFDVLSLYADMPEVKIIGAYDTDEVVCRPTLAQWDVGTKSPWVKRIGLCKCDDAMRPIDFFHYWEYVHAPLALHTHIGAASYIQQHFIHTMVPNKVAWNGMCILKYWNVDAFRFAHFSRPTAMKEIQEDCAAFLDKFYAMCGEEYTMKVMDNYIDELFDGYDGYYRHS